jgi:hypothetical protein
MTKVATTVLQWVADNFKAIVGLVTLACTYILANSQTLNLSPLAVVVIGGVLYVISQTDPNRDHVPPAPLSIGISSTLPKE